MPTHAHGRFNALRTAPWREVFADPGTGAWADRWSLDGDLATVTNGPRGMDFAAGPVAGDDAGHAVLWTRDGFIGDLKISYTFTKTDDTVENVNILYVLASGQGTKGFDRDVLQWSDRRRVPAMRLYFDHMNTYHISYAAFDTQNTDGDADADYIRARCYLPGAEKGLRGTELPPDHTRTGLFRTGVPHQITVIKRGDDLFMHIQNDGDERLCHWKTGRFPPLHGGRIGLRQMASRRSRYRDFRVSVAAIPGSIPPARSAPTAPQR